MLKYLRTNDGQIVAYNITKDFLPYEEAFCNDKAASLHTTVYMSKRASIEDCIGPQDLLEYENGEKHSVTSANWIDGRFVSSHPITALWIYNSKVNGYTKVAESHAGKLKLL